MKRGITLAVLMFLVAVAATSPTIVTASATSDGPIVITGLFMPESVIHDEKADLYLVSNFGGLTPGNGFISRVRPDGGFENKYWITGLLQPKGLAIDGDVLYVSDVVGVRLFDRRTGAPQGFWPVPFTPNYNWLNDVAVGPNGAIYATDSGLGLGPGFTLFQTAAMALYQFDCEGNRTVMAEGLPLAGPNGIVVNGANLFVATFFDNKIYRVNSSGHVFPVAEVPAFILDGLVRLRDGSLLVSSWSPPAIHKINPSRREVTTILDETSPWFYWNQSNPLFGQAPADIGFDYMRNRILIPVWGGNKVIIYPME